jgi:hypothetical protein
VSHLYLAVYGFIFFLVSNYLDKACRDKSNWGKALIFWVAKPLDWLNFVIENKLDLLFENPFEF